MSEPDRNDNKRLYEADTLNILKGSLKPLEEEDSGPDKSRRSPRRPNGSPVSGDTVRRIIDRIKGI